MAAAGLSADAAHCLRRAMVRARRGPGRDLFSHQYSADRECARVNTIDPRHRGRQRRALVALALLFFAPLALAFILYYGVGWRPGARVNHGDLVEPPVPLPDLALPPGEEAHPEAAGAAAPEAVAATASS